MIPAFCEREAIDPVSGFEAGRYTASNGFTIRFRLFSPELEKGKTYPLILHFHGMGSWTPGDNTVQVNVASMVLKKTHPAFILAPQTVDPMQWVDSDLFVAGHTFQKKGVASLEAACELAFRIAEKTSEIDGKRIYANGQSMGGYATWDAVTRYPDRFAAAVPVCGGGDVSMAYRIKDVPVWAFHGAADPAVPVENSRAMVSALKNAGSSVVRYTEFPETGHNAWDPAYAVPELFDWLFEQHR